MDPNTTEGGNPKPETLGNPWLHPPVFRLVAASSPFRSRGSAKQHAAPLEPNLLMCSPFFKGVSLGKAPTQEGITTTHHANSKKVLCIPINIGASKTSTGRGDSTRNTISNEPQNRLYHGGPYIIPFISPAVPSPRR